MAGYKTISMGLLMVVVALAGVSPVFAPFGPTIILNPTAACPGEVVQVSSAPYRPVPVAGSPGIGIIILSSDPGGLIGDYNCGLDQTSNNLEIPLCVFHVSESASCGVHYTVTVALSTDEASTDQAIIMGSAQFDVAGPCCAVGGCVQPVNTFALLSPWLAAIGLVGCISTVVVVAKKRHL